MALRGSPDGVTRPRLLWQAHRTDRGCPTGSGKFGRGRAGAGTNCTSGRSSPAAVFRKATDSNTPPASALSRACKY
jgi:hypothetical protein